MKFDWSKFKQHVEAQVIAAGGLPVPGPEKFKVVKAAAIQWLDDAIEPDNQIAEKVSDIGIRWGASLVEAFIQHRYESAKTKGLLE